MFIFLYAAIFTPFPNPYVCQHSRFPALLTDTVNPGLQFPYIDTALSAHVYNRTNVSLLCSQTVLTWGRARYIGRNDSETIPAAVEGIPAGQTITKVIWLVN